MAAPPEIADLVERFAEIDRLVYELYDLPEDEIKTVQAAAH